MASNNSLEDYKTLWMLLIGEILLGEGRKNFQDVIPFHKVGFVLKTNGKEWTLFLKHVFFGLGFCFIDISFSSNKRMATLGVFF